MSKELVVTLLHAASAHRKTGAVGTADLLAEASDALDALAARCAELERELDEASPMMKCDRCQKPMRLHTLIAEEGDEWECPECWERCNAQERAALIPSRKALDELHQMDQDAHTPGEKP